MITYRYGGKKGRTFRLAISDDHVVVRTQNRQPLATSRAFEVTPLSARARKLLQDFDLSFDVRSAGVTVLRSHLTRGSRAARDEVRAVLKEEPAIRFAGRVLCDPKTQTPVIYTENFFVKFDDDATQAACRKLLKAYKLEIKRPLEYARNAFFVAAPEDTGAKVFEIATALLEDPLVELCHPEIVREMRSRGAFPQQWHLKKTTIGGRSVDAHANVEAAWALSEGAGTTIAIIDDGVDLEHEEFRSSGKIVAPRNVSAGTNNPRPGNRDNHGTACAGVACGDGKFGASGVAPRARLIPIRFVSALGSQAEADAFVWAANNGADVISCSWGPPDGDWSDPSDPIHHEQTPLPDSTRLAMDAAIRNGRNGKGCVIVFAAGNGNESVDNDGYASYAKVIAVAASSDTGKKSVYSDFGNAVWCAFPSSDFDRPLTPGIWTTDRSGTVGYNPGLASEGDTAGHYTNSFGGTSSAAPGVAGVAALILARNPNLRWDEVRDILKRSCDRIDPAHGAYDANGHSQLYGYGRVNARKAVELAAPVQPNLIAIRTATQDVPIKDLGTSKLTLPVADTAAVKAIKVTVDIEHTYIGDLIVTLQPPAATGVAPIALHNREGRGADNIKKTYNTANTPTLAALHGKSPQGTWTLVVQDKDRADTGKIRGFTLELTL